MTHLAWLLARIRGILLDPRNEWPLIDRESGEPAHLFVNYVAILALIPALCGFIATTVIGLAVSIGTFRVPLLPGLLNALIGYFFSFVLVYLTALTIDLLAPRFRTRKHFPSALKLAAYSFTPAWLAGLFLLIPGLSFLTILGLYGFYLLWTGLPVLMRTPRDQVLRYAAVILAGALIIILALTFVHGAITQLSLPG
jgi:hypothetical protein